jgi:hypothetical protein
MAAVPNRRLRKLHQLLRHVVVRVGAQAGDQFCAALPVQVGAEHRFHAQLGEGALDH